MFFHNMSNLNFTCLDFTEGIESTSGIVEAATYCEVKIICLFHYGVISSSVNSVIKVVSGFKCIKDILVRLYEMK